MDFQRIKFNKKSPLFITVCFTILLLGIAYPIINKYYIKPKKWKDDFARDFQRLNMDIDKTKIINFTDCIYEKLLNAYGDVDNFPFEKNYTKEDKYNVANCLIDNVSPDSLKDYLRENIDLVIIKSEERQQKRLGRADSIKNNQ